eukprot:CAMPEP_0116983242 /NCGR_PEP_ID=MMETSP0467-20121206/60848_1 /TAXON_ID=283647 /ORGANISM="Mesodinium pulex, Strain SPMC105" /LENGTH=82 /DNA_ID=CAMNT_0004677941 /DNA_START=557 /DNA_END=805 /DNA_ORIENTATION=-
MTNRYTYRTPKTDENTLLIGDEAIGNLNVLDIAKVNVNNNIDGGAMKISKNLGDNIGTEIEPKFDPILAMAVNKGKDLVCLN